MEQFFKRINQYFIESHPNCKFWYSMDESKRKSYNLFFTAIYHDDFKKIHFVEINPSVLRIIFLIKTTYIGDLTIMSYDLDITTGCYKKLLDVSSESDISTSCIILFSKVVMNDIQYFGNNALDFIMGN